MKRFFRHVSQGIVGGCLVGVLSMCTGCGSAGNGYSQSEPLQSIDTAMGTIISQTLYVDNQMLENAGPKEQNKKITDEILKAITDLENNQISWRLDSAELCTVNESAGLEEGIVLSEELTEILQKCLKVSEESEGAFDITIGEVVRLWDIDSWAALEDASSYTLPTSAKLQESLKNVGYERVALQGNRLFLPSGMQLDLGAVGKGIALDFINNYLRETKYVTGAVISVGGSILTYGQKKDQSPWRVAVVNPADTSRNLGYLELDGQWCVSTSGDYERYVEVDGVRYHHIINPATGYPADSGLRSVTVLARDGLLSDALSTACFVLGKERGQELAEACDVEVLFVDWDGKIFMTEGMEQYFNLY